MGEQEERERTSKRLRLREKMLDLLVEHNGSRSIGTYDLGGMVTQAIKEADRLMDEEPAAKAKGE